MFFLGSTWLLFGYLRDLSSARIGDAQPRYTKRTVLLVNQSFFGFGGGVLVRVDLSVVAN